MQLGHVSSMNMLAMAVTCFISFALPIGLLIFGRVKYKAKIASFFTGCLVMLVMALIIESLIHRIVFSATGTLITGNIWLYGLYGGFMAALFEETGRFIAMKFFMKKNLDFANGFMYGAGHGGFEAIAIVGLTYISNLSTSAMINSGVLESTLKMLDSNTADQTVEALRPLWESAPTYFLWAGWERIFAICLQIALSLFVYRAVKYNKFGFFCLSFGIHFVVDFVTVVLNSKAGVLATEISIAVMAVAAIVLAYYLNKDENKEK